MINIILHYTTCKFRTQFIKPVFKSDFLDQLHLLSSWSNKSTRSFWNSVVFKSTYIRDIYSYSYSNSVLYIWHYLFANAPL